MKRVITFITLLCVILFSKNLLAQGWIKVNQLTGGMHEVTAYYSNPVCNAYAISGSIGDQTNIPLENGIPDTFEMFTNAQIEYGSHVLAFANLFNPAFGSHLVFEQNDGNGCENMVRIYDAAYVSCSEGGFDLLNTMLSSSSEDYQEVEGECVTHGLEFGFTSSARYSHLCPGVYEHDSFGFFLGDPAGFYPDVEAKNFDIVTVNESVLDGCDGSASIENLQFFINPQTYIWSHEALITDSEVDDLCSGYYTASVVDFNSDTISKEFVITSSVQDFTFQENSDDTLYFYYEECGLDYNLPIDSVVIDDVVYLNYDSTVVLLEWSLYQNGVGFTFSEYVNGIDLESVVIYFGIYCSDPGKILGSDNVKMVKFNGVNIDALGFNNIENPILFEVYPNPTLSILMINTDIDYKRVTLVDVSGQFIMELEKENDVSHLSKGIYFVQVDYGNQILTKKLLIR